MEGSRLTASKNKLIQPTLDMPSKKHSKVFFDFLFVVWLIKTNYIIDIEPPRKNRLTKICKNSIIFWKRVKAEGFPLHLILGK